ncbi:SAC3/GANP/Nin1/mts3/eIF-3 p25 family-domain-containing protein [Dipodascopsis uninucleata]
MGSDGSARSGGYANVSNQSSSASYQLDNSNESSKSQQTIGSWPDSLKTYVNKCFAVATPSQRPAMEKNLKNMISKSMHEQTLWSTDWSSLPLPTEIADDDTDVLEALRKDKGLQQERMNSTKSKRSDKWDQRSTSSDSKNSKSTENAKSASKRKDNSAESLEELERKEKRLRRFENHTQSHKSDSSRSLDEKYGLEYSPSPFTNNSESEQFVGRCTKLEKNYLRLTSAPDPETVRPLHILRKTLDLLKEKWKKEQNYAYICDQFKSLRQDLTVQRIQNEFTVNVYEIHARIALEKGDLGEYNQCQTQLKSLYAKNIPGHPREFTAYMILYLLHTRNKADMNDLLIELTDDEKADLSIRHALQVYNAVNDSDYHALMRLYLIAPNMGGYVMDSFIERERLKALEIICKAFRPEVPLRFLTDEIGFDNDNVCYGFLEKYQLNAFLSSDTLKLRTKDALPYVQHHRLSAFKKIDIKGQI